MRSRLTLTGIAALAFLSALVLSMANPTYNAALAQGDTQGTEGSTAQLEPVIYLPLLRSPSPPPPWREPGTTFVPIAARLVGGGGEPLFASVQNTSDATLESFVLTRVTLSSEGAILEESTLNNVRASLLPGEERSLSYTQQPVDNVTSRLDAFGRPDAIPYSPPGWRQPGSQWVALEIVNTQPGATGSTFFTVRNATGQTLSRVAVTRAVLRADGTVWSERYNNVLQTLAPGEQVQIVLVAPSPGNVQTKLEAFGIP